MGTLTLFQIIVVGVLGMLFIGVVVAGIRGWSTRREAFLWGTLCFVAAVATLRPNLTTDLAKMLSINRGADLITYVAIIMMMIGFWTTYMRLRHLRRELTSLVRHIAILEAHDASSSDATADHAMSEERA
ncbi:MAG: DUF2304 domain-containing protein [Phycisphaerales bacterium]|nr:DUF2304 domain-containing protein [Phycisphaerales bacterium]MCB9857944.1 DUF2304 domain-containing protein [Phycisphaerales bacterium]